MFFAVVAAALLFPPAVRADNDTLPVPAFPLDEAGRIEIAGAGGSALTRQEMVSCTKEWIYDNFEEATIEEDTSSGSLRVSGSFLIAEEEQENLNTVMELMAYAVTVVCDDYRYAYSIDDVGAYVVTLVPFAEEETSGTEYEIVDSVYISLPGDYVVLMDDAYRERAGCAASWRRCWPKMSPNTAGVGCAGTNRSFSRRPIGLPLPMIIIGW